MMVGRDLWTSPAFAGDVQRHAPYRAHFASAPTSFESGKLSSGVPFGPGQYATATGFRGTG
jgi:hypothetical protein